MKSLLQVIALSVCYLGMAKADLFESFNANVSAGACDIYDTQCNTASKSSSDDQDPNLSVFVNPPDGLSPGIYAATTGSDSLWYGSIILDVSAEACCEVWGSAGINATAGFSDSVTIFGGTGTGELLYTVNKVAGMGGAPPDVVYYTATTTIPLTFTFNQPFTIGMEVTEFAAVDPVGLAGMNVTYSLATISVFDSSGNPLTGYHYMGGTAYPFVGGLYGTPPVPEPSALVLFGTCVALAAWRACRTKDLRRPV
jgi:hypothetical protein